MLSSNVLLLRVSDRIKATLSHCNMQQQQQRNQLFQFKYPNASAFSHFKMLEEVDPG